MFRHVGTERFNPADEYQAEAGRKLYTTKPATSVSGLATAAKYPKAGTCLIASGCETA